MITSLVSRLKQRIEMHRRYRKAIAEIAALSQDDLIDIGAFQNDLYRSVHKEIYG